MIWRIGWPGGVVWLVLPSFRAFVLLESPQFESLSTFEEAGSERETISMRGKFGGVANTDS
jgi:hypothetical protein